MVWVFHESKFSLWVEWVDSSLLFMVALILTSFPPLPWTERAPHLPPFSPSAPVRSERIVQDHPVQFLQGVSPPCTRILVSSCQTGRENTRLALRYEASRLHLLRRPWCLLLLLQKRLDSPETPKWLFDWVSFAGLGEEGGGAGEGRKRKRKRNRELTRARRTRCR